MKENNHNVKKNIKGRSQLKWTLFLLTFLIVILQFYSLLYKLPFDASMSNKKMGFFNLFLYNLTQSFSLWIPLIEFIVAQIILQIALTLLVYFCTIKTSTLFKSCKNVFSVGLILWFSAQMCILVWNIFLYPYSYYSLSLQPIIATVIGNITFVMLLIVTTIISLTAIVLAMICTAKQRPKIFFSIFIIFLLAFSGVFSVKHMQIPQKNMTANPNVILIMTDSLRPDYVNLKIHNHYVLPHLQSLLKDSIFFPNSFTTLGRSTPGLVTMLTGKYPKNNGARFNLIENQELKLNDSLTNILKKQGYKTLLFTDSLQFINVSPEYGFDKIFGPRRGIYDFIFTFINDLPISNLLMNTPVGEWLFPYNYANRISYHTYTPNAFVSFFNRHLQFLKIDKPTFMVIDLTLPHWPYVWAKQPLLPALPYRYLDSLKALDKQLGMILPILQQKNMLDKAILIVASDHGDSFGVPGERYIREQKYIGPKERLNYITKYPYSVQTKESANKLIGLDTSTGHGTDLLSASQLNTTLAFRLYGNQYQPKTVPARVALIDIAPTILDLLNLPIADKDGISLKQLMLNPYNTNSFARRPIFLESEIEIPTIDVTVKNQSRSAINHLIDQYADLYYVNLDTQTLVLKSEAVKKLLKDKQRGVMKENWLLVHFPGTNNTQSEIINDTKQELDQCYYAYAIENKTAEKKYVCYLARPSSPYYVLINLNNYQWQILFDKEAQQNPVFKNLLQELKQFYGNEMLR